MAGNNLIKTIVILSGIPLSDKVGAGYSRVLEYAKGLVTNDNTIVYLASLSHENHSQKHFLYNNNITLLGNKRKTKDNFFYDKYFNFKRRKKALSKILSIVQNENNKIIFLLYPFFNTWYEEAFYIKEIRNCGYKIFSERNERALGILFNSTRPKGFIKIIIYYLIQPFEYINAFKQDQLVRKYDGNIVISTKFEKWIKNKNPNFLRIPILGDELVVGVKSWDNRSVYKIGYTGAINFKKDGMGHLLKAIHIVINKYSLNNIELNIFGFGSKTEVHKLIGSIEYLGLSDVVKYHGSISAKQIREIQRNQDLLVLIRKPNIQTNYGFSTKLAEYIASGIPVLLTDVSDNKLYLKENEAAFYTSYNADKIANALIEIKALKSTTINNIVSNAINVRKENFKISVYQSVLNNFLN